MAKQWKESVRARLEKYVRASRGNGVIIGDALRIQPQRIRNFVSQGYLGTNEVKRVEEYLDRCDFSNLNNICVDSRKESVRARLDGLASPAASDPTAITITLDPTADDKNTALAIQRAMVEHFGEARAHGLARMLVAMHEFDFALLYGSALKSANPEIAR